MLREDHRNNNNQKSCRTNEDPDLLVMKFGVILPGKECRLIKMLVEDKDNI